MPWRKRKRRGRNDDSDDEEEEDDFVGGRGGGRGKGVSSFITAKDQYKINQYKTKGRGQGYHHAGGSSLADNEEMDIAGHVSTSSYGNNKKSLGTR